MDSKVMAMDGVEFTGEFIRKFWDRVEADKDTGCWNFTSSGGSGGYGVFHQKGKFLRAHRISWTLRNGDIPEGMFICHHCDNPRCVRPSHIFLGTHVDNMKDMKRKGRGTIEEKRGEKNPKAKLVREQIYEIRKMYDDGTHTIAQIAELYPVKSGQIRNIVLREKWGWLPEMGSMR